MTVSRRVVLPVRFAREETGPFNRGGAGGSLITPSAPYLRGNRHRCHVGFALGKVFAVKFNGLVFDRLGGGVTDGRFLFLFVDGRGGEKGAGRGAFYSAGGTARRSFAIDLKRISKRERETLAFLGSVVEPSSARRRLRLINNRP